MKFKLQKRSGFGATYRVRFSFFERTKFLCIALFRFVARRLKEKST